MLPNHQLNITRDIPIVSYGGEGDNSGVGGKPAYVAPKGDSKQEPLFVLEANRATLSVDNVLFHGFQAGVFTLSAKTTLVTLTVVVGMNSTRV